MTLPEAIASVLPPDDNLRIGVVASVHPLVVNVQGALIPAGALSPYTPITGDSVAMLRQDSTWLCLGRTTDPASGAFPQFQAGSVTANVVAAASLLVAVVFAIPFATVPAVAVNISTAPGPSAGWGVRAINVTTAGFDAFLFGTAGTFTTPVQWQAQEMTQ